MPIPSSSAYPVKPGNSAFSQQKTPMLNDMLCFFCREKGHGSRNCPSFLDFVDRGILVKKEGTNMHMLKDGGFIPKDDDKYSKRDKVLKIAKERGWYTDNQGVFFFEEPDEEDVMSHYMVEAEENVRGTDEELLELFRHMLKSTQEKGETGRDVADMRSKNF